MGLLLIFLLMAMGISFLCSLLESVLMSTPISYITMKEEEGDRNAKLFAKLKDDIDRPIAAILSLNTIANTIAFAVLVRLMFILSPYAYVQIDKTHKCSMLNVNEVSLKFTSEAENMITQSYTK